MAHSIAFAIVDDNSRDLQRLRHSVEAISGCTVMFAYTSPNQFFQQLVSTHQLPDVVITDCQMPEIDGMGLTRLLQLWHPEIKIIVVSGLLTEPDVAELMDIGASAIIAKGLLYTGNLPKAMEAIAHQQIFIDPCWDEAVVKQHLQLLQQKKDKEEAQKFNNNELKILQLIATNKNHKEIAELLNLSAKTIDNYAQKIAQKTGQKNKTGILIYAIKKNLVKLFRN